ncbi:hypothetical protein [Roseivivax sp. CAU 1753]
MLIRTLAASAALAITSVAASAQGTPDEALQIAAAQGACGGDATIQSAVFIDANTISVTCLRVGGAGDLGGTLGTAGLAAGGVLFAVLISTIGGDGGGGDGTTSGT